MYICDYPRVAAGGSTTVVRRHVVGENISISWIRHSGHGRKAAAHPQFLREQPLFLWAFYLKDSVAMWEQTQGCFYYAVCSGSWRMHDLDREIWGCIEHIVIKHLKEKMIIIKNTCKILLGITCETHSDALTCWNYQRQFHQQPKCYNYFQMKAKAASRLTFSFLLPGAVHSWQGCYPACLWKALPSLITMEHCAFKDYKATMQRVGKFIGNNSVRIKQSCSLPCFTLGTLFILPSEIWFKVKNTTSVESIFFYINNEPVGYHNYPLFFIFFDLCSYLIIK